LAVEPQIRRNEVVRLLEDGLQDISISRQRQAWGIPFPGDTEQTVYVWFDALTNYLSATGFPDAGYERLWPADLHVVGKNITRFHCIIWPAMLLAADLPLPRAVRAHGFVLWEGTKMSKTAGTAPTRCGISCCGKSAWTTTASSPGSGSTRATRASLPTPSATS